MIRRLPGELEEPVSLSSLRETVGTLAETATTTVDSVRTAFVAGSAPFQTVGSGSVSSFIASLGKDPLSAELVQSTARFGLVSTQVAVPVSPPRPELDKAEVIEGPGGVLDQFSVRLTISIRAEEIEGVRSIRILRAKRGKVETPRPLFSALSFAPAGGRIGSEKFGGAFRVDELGVGNTVTAFLSEDRLSDRRIIMSPAEQELRPPVPPPNTNRGQTSMGLLSVEGVDRSVLEDASFYLNRRAVGDAGGPVEIPLTVGQTFGVHVLGGDSVAEATSGIVQVGNAIGFAEVAIIDPRTSLSRRVGSFVEFSTIDRAVVYGGSYLYAAVSLGSDGANGPRSRIINVQVRRQIPPRSPEVSFGVIARHPRFVIRAAMGTDHIEVFRSGRTVEDAIVLGSEQTLVLSSKARKVGEFFHLGDIGVGPDGSTTFVDRSAIAGDRLTYRFYAVDSYGLKSQTPFTCDLFLPEDGHLIPLSVPSVTVEQAAGRKGMTVRAWVDDPRVVGFFMNRREVTINERAVHQINQPEVIDLGVFSPKRIGSRRGPLLQDVALPSYFSAVSGAMLFTDTTVRIDRVYQYAISAVDARGNRTAMAGSQPVGIFAKPMIDTPVGLSGSVIIGAGDLPAAVLLTWVRGTNDFSPTALVDDQDVLAATSVRSVFQVERRKTGAPFWDALPATSESYFIDAVSDTPAPPFRPPFLTVGLDYEYRILAMQSGGLLSERTAVIPVSVVSPPSAPPMVWARTTPLGVYPLAIVVSWNGTSNFVLRWEVERAALNKLYATRITSMNSSLARGLQYSRVADISPESSRGRSITADTFGIDRSIYVGNRFYVDGDVDLANSYFYRVRTVGRNGTSDWSYAGIVLTDSGHDLKFMSTLTDDERVDLADDPRPISRKFIP